MGNTFHNYKLTRLEVIREIGNSDADLTNLIVNIRDENYMSMLYSSKTIDIQTWMLLVNRYKIELVSGRKIHDIVSALIGYRKEKEKNVRHRYLSKLASILGESELNDDNYRLIVFLDSLGYEYHIEALAVALYQTQRHGYRISGGYGEKTRKVYSPNHTNTMIENTIQRILVRKES